MGKRESNKSLSIHDVALKAGVSIATVSRVINGKDRVAPETRQRVEEAMRVLDFRPNRSARALGLRKTNTIGLVLPDFSGDFFGELMQGVDTAARESGINLMVIRAVDAEEEMQVIEEFLGSGAVDGLIFMISQLDDRAIHSIARHRDTLLVIDRDVGDEGIDNVLVDNRSGGYDATAHLLNDCQATHLAFIGGPETNVDTRDRYLGFCDAAREAGMKVPTSAVFYTDYSYDEGTDVANEIAPRIRSSKGRWGIVSANDSLARGVVDGLLDLGIAIPDQAAVVGYDDSTLARLTRPKLSSVRIPLR